MSVQPPRIAKSPRREMLTLTMSAATVESIDRLAARFGMARGRVVDAAMGMLSAHIAGGGALHVLPTSEAAAAQETSNAISKGTAR